MKAIEPIIVATQDFIGQMSSIGTTTIFTPSVDGTFRVDAICDNNPSNASSGNLGQLFVIWTDEFGVTSTIQASDEIGFDLIVSRILRLKAGQPLQVNTTLAGSGPWLYDVFVVVTQYE